MSERLPYEDQLPKQWDGLTLPGEDMAWEDMRQRLEEDDDDRFVAWWQRGCVIWGLLLLVLLAIVLYLLKPQQWFNSKKSEISNSVQISSDRKGDTLANKRGEPGTGESQSLQHEQFQQGDTLNRGSEKTSVNNSVANEDISASRIEDGHQVNSRVVKLQDKSTISIDVAASSKKKHPNKTITKSPQPTVGVKATTIISTNPGAAKTTTPSETVIPSGTNKTDQASSVKDSTIAVAEDRPVNLDSVKKDSLTSNDTIAKIPVAPKGKNDSTKKKNYFFSAGLAMQQQIPLDSQKAVPYSASGRKGTLSDYIPSVYARFNREKKWFIQLEFKYGAPQYTRSILYDVKTDSTGTGPITTSSILKKTYYHQLPLSFNYYILEGWSIGAGISWNRFSSAVTEQSVRKRIPGTQIDTLISQEIIKVKSDSSSVFAKSYFQALFETQYQWKRFSLGARYSFGLDPYIEFTLPGGVKQEEKNSSLQLFLRFELFRQKKP